MTHKEQYEHPKWQKKRLEIFERDDYTCCDCKSKDNQLSVHHGYYELGLKMWEYDNDTLWTLCKGCHDKWGEIKRMLQKGLAKIDFTDDRNYTLLLGLFERMGRKSDIFTPMFRKNEEKINQGEDQG